MIVQFLIDLLVDRYDRSFVFWHSERGKDFRGKILDGYVELTGFKFPRKTPAGMQLTHLHLTASET